MPRKQRCKQQRKQQQQVCVIQDYMARQLSNPDDDPNARSTAADTWRGVSMGASKPHRITDARHTLPRMQPPRALRHEQTK